MKDEMSSVYQNRPSEATVYPSQAERKPETAHVTMDELIRSNKELEQFAFAVSHDLQEPLKVISLYLQIFNRSYKGRLDDKADAMISSVLDKAVRMEELIQSTLNYAQAGKGSIHFTKLDSGIIFDRAIKNLKATIEENSAQIRREGFPVIMGDGIQLTRLFQNLINNAIKFRKKTELPYIYVSVKQKDGQWLFSIKDNGIGIEPKYIRSIFEVFRRLHTYREYAGNGIGLALCKKIVESHGGSIWAESEFGKGTTIYFTVPAI